jgi:hypothetical protein
METPSSISVERGRLRVDGRPALIQAGTLHYVRLPHPDLWDPVLQRMRMAGLNAVVVPCPWAYHSPAPGHYDVTGPRDLEYLFDVVADNGLWLIPHAGPWVPAQMNAGGLPPWFMHHPDVQPHCESTAPVGPSFAFLRYVREWWEQVLPLLRERPNLLLLALDPGPCVGQGALPRYVTALIDLAQEMGVEVPLVTPALPGAAESVALVPLYRRPPSGEGPGLYVIDTGPEGAPGRGTDSDIRAALARTLGPEHPKPRMCRAAGLGATCTTLSPAHAGATWGYWGTPQAPTVHGVGAPILEGGELPPAYDLARQTALLLETLGDVLTGAYPTSTGYAPQVVYTSDPACLQATRASATTTVAFLGAPDTRDYETRVSLALGDELLTSEPLWLPAGSARVLPLHWPVAGGQVMTTTLEPVLRITVAGRHLLVLSNPTGGDLLLSADFRPHHARGPVRTQRTDAGLSVRFEAARLTSLLLDGPDGTLQLLALAPRFATRVWPLDDSWRTTPTYPAHWTPAPEDPARGLVIGPDFVQPQPDGGYEYLVTEKGFGYRWGPWRGSDPKTWLAPIMWRAPQPVRVPELAWTTRAGAPEVLPHYDDRAWRPAAVGTPSAPQGQTTPYGFVWYRGSFEGRAREVTLHCPHAADVFLNGTLVAALNAPRAAGAPSTRKTLPLPPHLLRSENVLAVLVEVLGDHQSWDTVSQGQGLLACALDGDTPLRWRMRHGLSGERTVQGFPGFADWPLVPDDGTDALVWHRATFGLALPEAVEVPLFLHLERAPTRSYIYFNGQLVGRYGEVGVPQTRFWLPAGLRQRGDNELLIAQWTRGASPGLGVARLVHGTVRQRRHQSGKGGWAGSPSRSRGWG